MKIVLISLKCAGVVYGSYLGFAFLWSLFLVTVNPSLSAAISHGVRQSAVHLFALDTLEFIWNWPVFPLWAIAAFLFFFWISWKRPDRSKWRRAGFVIYLTPFVALTMLVIVATLVQARAQPVLKSPVRIAP